MKTSKVYQDISGQKFGRLTAIRRIDDNTYQPVWECICDCGKIRNVRARNLFYGITKSCGCLQKEIVTQKGTIHGKSHTRLFNIWQYMKRRCYNPNYKYYNYYGGRGITICDEWKHDFESFYGWATANGYADGLTIDRINSNGNYEPSNCQWVTRLTQQNNLRSNHRYTINGETKTIAEWCRVYNVPHERTRRRVVNEGWDILKALTTPALKRNGQPR